MDEEQDDLDKSGVPNPGDDPAGEAPFAVNNDDLSVEAEQPEDLGEEAMEVFQTLDALDVEGDDTPIPSVPDSKDSASTFTPVEVEPPEIADEGRPPFGADPAALDLETRVSDSSTTVGEASLPDFGDMDATARHLESFGNDLNAFHEAGGESGGGGYDGDSADASADDTADAASQLMDSDLGNRNKTSEMLIEHARLIDEITRSLELERL